MAAGSRVMPSERAQSLPVPCGTTASVTSRVSHVTTESQAITANPASQEISDLASNRIS